MSYGKGFPDSGTFPENLLGASLKALCNAALPPPSPPPLCEIESGQNIYFIIIWSGKKGRFSLGYEHSGADYVRSLATGSVGSLCFPKCKSALVIVY